MKIIFLLVGLMLNLKAFAEFEPAKLEPRHRALIEKALIEKCAISPGVAEEISSVKEHISIDTGVYEENFISQFFVNDYYVTVNSSYGSNYDHSTGESGSYRVDKISECQSK
ncbi:MAG: hypothetical protein JNM39_02540 [Bdellovibrionaceae bacterium]|nr:hypothetical protein [Pseudobdellovibrionaceae bacterium]